MSVAPIAGTFDDDYGRVLIRIYAAPTQEDTRYVVETLLYKLPEGKPVWTGTSESVNPNSRQELVAEITRLVGNELRKEKLLGAP
jgi:hypothetical protein